MLDKLHKLARFSRRDTPKPPSVVAAAKQRVHRVENSLALRIVHAGGQVECYYMAIPATTILDKYPSHVLAKPEVFKKPWDSVLRPENILRPGQKFYLVPRHTVTQLRQKIRRPGKDVHDASKKVAPLPKGNTSTSAPLVGHRQVDEGIALSSVRGCFSTGFKQKLGSKKHVSFALVDQVKHKARADSSASGASSSRKSSSESRRLQAGKTKPLKAITWGPSLTAIDESQGN